MKNKNCIVFVFAVISDDFILYGRTDDGKSEILADSFKRNLKPKEIEIVNPTNIYLGERIKFNKDYMESGIIRSKDEYERIKEFLTSDTNESTDTGYPTDMPELARNIREQGGYVFLRNGKWYAAME